MIGEYLRVTPAELDRALRDPGWALDLVDGLRDAEEDSEPPAGARLFSTYKTWDLLRFLLARTGFPVNVIQGEEVLCESEDWGYGPPGYLRPERVRLAARLLRALPYDGLIDGVDPAGPAEAELYPWGRGGSVDLDWARPWYDGMTRFFESAAEADDAVLVWLD
ncbi:hypothetical protein GCM10010515_67870 [Streptomyces fructofermentans]|uniref:DUF1877 domain-containing protein n=2 Tax=Streptomyces fructofermentans TaxID=152141 RepID=A0A918NRX0_9ACTN|nr:hypothetical protein GCM10010515_67870 [Streptomyces fructofermentans]